MRPGPTITTIEMHTGGEPFRIVTGGYPTIPGDTIVARRAWLRAKADHRGQALIFEPRGHADMYAGLLTDPVTPGADLGVIFAHNEGFGLLLRHGLLVR